MERDLIGFATPAAKIIPPKMTFLVFLFCVIVTESQFLMSACVQSSSGVHKDM